MWCILGDYNDQLYRYEKRGGSAYPNWLLPGFKNVISDCCLIELKLNGYPFTWERSKGTPNWVEEKLNRGFASSSWCQMFKEAKLVSLDTTSFDHLPIFFLVIEVGICATYSQIQI